MARNTGLLIAGDFATKVALVVLYAVIGRTLGKQGFGNYTVAISFAFFVTASELGIDVILSREVARDRSNVHGLFWNTLVLKSSAGTLVLALVVGLSVAGGYPATVTATTALIGVSNLIDVLAQSPQAVLRGLEDMGPPARALALESLIVVCIGAFVLLVVHGSLVGLGVAYVIASVIAAGYIWRVLGGRGVHPRRRGHTRGLAWLARAAVPTGITAFFGYALGRADALILSALTNKSSTVGLYGAAYRIFEATLFVSWAFGIAVYPRLSNLPSRSDALRSLLEFSMKATACVTVLFGAVMALYGRLLSDAVFGHGFAGSATAVRILGGAAGLYGIFTIAALTLAARDRQQAFPIVITVTLALNVALNLLLIPSLSLNGSAVAMTAAQLLLTLLVVVLLRSEVGRLSLTRIFTSICLGIIPMIGIALILGGGVFSLLLALLAYGVIFAAAETRLNPDDVHLILVAVRARGRGTPPVESPSGPASSSLDGV